MEPPALLPLDCVVALGESLCEGKQEPKRVARATRAAATRQKVALGCVRPAIMKRAALLEGDPSSNWVDEEPPLGLLRVRGHKVFVPLVMQRAHERMLHDGLQEGA